MGTDCEAVIRIKADQQLQEIEKKYPGFIHVCLLITTDIDLLFISCFKSGICCRILSSSVQMYRISCCTTPNVGGGFGVGISREVLHLYVMGKALSGKLSCVSAGLFLKFILIGYHAAIKICPRAYRPFFIKIILMRQVGFDL